MGVGQRCQLLAKPLRKVEIETSCNGYIGFSRVKVFRQLLRCKIIIQRYILQFQGNGCRGFFYLLEILKYHILLLSLFAKYDDG